MIPDLQGTPENFIRWGQAGLAFVTTGSPGQLYLLDGNFVNPSGTQDTTNGNPVNPVPMITAISPLTATAGSGGATLTVTGTNFIGQPTVYWNGTALPTALASNTQLSATVPASPLASAMLAQITVKNGSSSLPASNAVPFAVDPSPPTGDQITVYGAGGSDLVWNANTGLIYVSMPGVQGSAGDAIGIVDPTAGTVSSSGFLGSDPYKLSLSSGGQYLYVGLNGANQIAQLTLPNLQVNANWNVGGIGSFNGPYYAIDLQAAPAAPQTTAVVLGSFGISPPEAELVIYDGPTARPNPLQVTQYPYSSLQWGGNDSTLYAVDAGIPQDFLVLGVSSSGAVLNQPYQRLLNSYSPAIHFDEGTGLVYTDTGFAIQPSTGTIAGTYGASGIAVPDSTLNRVFVLYQTSAQAGTLNYTIASFNQTTFAPVGSITVSNVVGEPTALVRWGSNGLAFTTLAGSPISFTGNGPGQLYVISGTFVTQ
ncbi:MAG: IPT/TIG domain-containing protein [Terracidiphilus sp.]